MENWKDNFTMNAARTRAAKAAFAGYSRPSYYHKNGIYSAYTRPSVYKVRAWEYCKELCRKLNGRGLMILGHGAQTFSVGFTFTDPEGVNRFAYITRDYNSVCEI